ncbi:MAG: hypothetical protein GX085_00855 [Firmicutes bacterium]|nr:hypothetical protein [Bacillota bacterium]
MKNLRWWLLIIVAFFFFGFLLAYRGEFIRFLREAGVYQLPPRAVKTVTLQITDIYLGCRHSENHQDEVTAVELPVLLKKMQENRKISVFTGEVLVLNGEFPGLCPVCQEEEFIGVYQGHVAVYAGRPGRPGPVKEMTLLNIQGLPEEEIADLETGITFMGLEEKLRILEAYSEEYVRNNRPED